MSPTAHNKGLVLHGANLDLLGRRPSEHYGELTLIELETRVKRFGRELDLELAFFQTNHEGDFIERLHRVPDAADAVILNPGPGRTTAMRFVTRSRSPRCPRSRCTCRTSRREQWRRHSVLEGLVVATISGKGADGYREALELVHRELGV